MKQRLVIIALALSFSISLLHAQTPYAFKVLVSKGKTEVKSTHSWEAIKIGTSLKASDEIRVAENSYLALIYSNGKPLEVRDAKTYKVSELVSKVPTGSTALNKYTDFILSKQEVKRDRLAATGAVTRTVVKDLILVYLPGEEQSSVYGDKVFLQWSSEGIQTPYEVIFTNLSGDELNKFEVQKPELTVSIGEGNFKSENEFMVKVISKTTRGQGSKEYFFKKVRPAEREKLDALFKEVKENADKGTALGQYMMAAFYEENFLLIDALTAYREASLLAPDVDLYKTAYSDFMKRMGFTK